MKLAASTRFRQTSMLCCVFGFSCHAWFSDLCDAAVQVYGEGFRIAMEKFQQRGLKALVKHVIAHGAWPDWHA